MYSRVSRVFLKEKRAVTINFLKVLIYLNDVFLFESMLHNHEQGLPKLMQHLEVSLKLYFEKCQLYNIS